MNLLGLRSITVKKFNHVGNSKTDNTKEYPNLLEQNFFADKPSKKWVGDITYVYIKETGWTHLAVVMDLFDLKIVGWQYGINMTDDLVIEAFYKALINRELDKDAIFHSDRGSQYTSNDFEQLLNELNIKHSYSKKGYPYDNASMESFNAILKKEEVNINSSLYKIDLNNNYIFINGEINDSILNNISKSDNITLSINDGNLSITYNNEVVKSLKLLNVYSTKYDINLENGYIYTKGDTSSSNITSNISYNVSLSVKDNKLNIKYNNISVMDLNILFIKPSDYKINYDNRYIYTYSDNTLDLINKKVNIANGSISISNNKLQLKYNDLLVDEFTLYYLSSSIYKFDGNTIYIKGSVEYNTFINNLTFNGLSYKVYNTSNQVVNSGNIDDNFVIKVLIGDSELNAYNIKAEYFEISDELSIKDDEKIIYNIISGTTCDELIKNIDTSGTIEFYNKAGNKLEKSSIVGTSSVIKIKLSTKTYEYKIAVLGDLTGDGMIKLGDVSKLYSGFRGRIELDDVEILAGDTTRDGIIKLGDKSKLYSYFRGRISSL